MSELVSKLLFLTRVEQRLVAALDIHGILSDEILKELGYDAKSDPSSIDNLNTIISVLNNKMPNDLQLVKIRRASIKQGLGPVIVFARDYTPTDRL